MYFPQPPSLLTVGTDLLPEVNMVTVGQKEKNLPNTHQ